MRELIIGANEFAAYAIVWIVVALGGLFGLFLGDATGNSTLAFIGAIIGGAFGFLLGSMIAGVLILLISIDQHLATIARQASRQS